MDIVNPTGDVINLMYDSIPYVFGPRKILTVGDEAGVHLLHVGKRYGLVEVHFGDDPEEIRYAGLRSRILYYRQTLDGHELVNQRQKEQNFPVIVDSDAVRQARLALPIYEKYVKVLENKLGAKADAAYQADLDALLSGASQDVVPDLSKATITELRDEATKLQIRWDPAWTPIDLREAIGHAIVTKGVPKGPPAIPSPSGSSVAPAPPPGVLPEDLGGAFAR